MFRLNGKEVDALNRSQIVTGSQRHRDPRYPPYAFTQEGVAMLSGVLRSQRAVQGNILIVRAFVRLREVLATHEDPAQKLEELEKKVTGHDKEIKALKLSVASWNQASCPSASRLSRFPLRCHRERSTDCSAGFP